MDGAIIAILVTVVPFLFASAIVLINVFGMKRKNEQQQQQNRAQQVEEQYSQRNADEQQRRQEELKQRLQQKYGQLAKDEQAAKHAKHVADSHAHEHLGQEEHYEEIVGSLGEVNDEGCEDLAGVRFIATDLAYELQDSDSVNYDRLAQAMVLGEVINNPRFKQPYSRRKY